MTTMSAPSKIFTPAEQAKIEDGIRYLASQCDGAHSKDHAGFDHGDTKRGKYLASAVGHWKDYELYWAWERLTKYRGQLDRAGFETVVAMPPVVEYPTWEERHAAERAAFVAAPLRQIKRTEQGFEISYRHNDPGFNDLLADVRLIPGRRFVNGVNHAPLSSEVAVNAFGLKHGFVWNSFKVNG